MTPPRLRFAEFFRPIYRWAPRGYGFFYKLLLGNYYSGYPADPELKRVLDRRFRVFWDKYLQAYIYVDIGDWACRAHYFKGIYYDRIVPLLIDRILSTNGGVFLDIGANRGMHTLYAARVLGKKGKVYAFEPNPSTFEVLKAHLTINQIENCIPMNIGISSAEDVLRLNMFSDYHSGTCSFVSSSEVVAEVAVPVRRLDDVVDADALVGPVLVKIDVEGFEHNVLQGMTRILARPDVTVICELTDAWLRQTGSSAHALVADMVSRGFKPMLPRVEYVHWIRECLVMEPLGEHPSGPQFDAVFVR
jgi:FkbM family methyltransferase